MTKFELQLTDATAQAAKAAGLLTSQTLERLLKEALQRQQAADALLRVADHVRDAGIEHLSMEEINAEVKAARQVRRQRAGSY
jgi:hypothetical protein